MNGRTLHDHLFPKLLVQLHDNTYQNPVYLQDNTASLNELKYDYMGIRPQTLLQRSP